MAQVAADITVTDEQFRAFLDRNPNVLRDFLSKEARCRSAWWVETLRREARIGSLENFRRVV